MDFVPYALQLAHFVFHAQLEEFALFAQQDLLEILVLHVQLVITIILMLQHAELVKHSVPSVLLVMLLEQPALLAQLAIVVHSVVLANQDIIFPQMLQLPARFAQIQMLTV